jgi:predicted small metal-binding protein
MGGRLRVIVENNERSLLMARKYIDCRDYPQASKSCSVAISADNTDEVVEAAVEHGVKIHGFKDTPDLRNELKSAVREGSPRP